MPQERPKVSLKLCARHADEASGSTSVISQAIASRLCIRAIYNRGAIIFAPHILYERHGEPFVYGVVLEREGAQPGEVKLGTFKLAGLQGMAGTSQPFRPLPGFDATEERYAERTISRLEG